MLEHSANPLKALREWLRLLKPGGTLFLVLPHREGTFDHRRPVTPLRHLVEDFEQQMGEDDLTHLPEILQLHDLRRDPEAGGFETFKARSERNRENRGLHHHVFDTRRVVELLDHVGVQIRAVESTFPFHIATLATRLASGQRPDNTGFLGMRATYRGTSPFRTDRAD
jgi:SAM-dependent methyltransferase